MGGQLGSFERDHDRTTQMSLVSSDTSTNREKDPDDWATSGAQASYSKTLCEEAGEPFDAHLTKAEASRRIEELQAKTGRGRDH